MLTHILCQRSIQQGKGGHSPIEDAIAAMELVQLKLAKGLAFGDVMFSDGKSDWELKAQERLLTYVDKDVSLSTVFQEDLVVD